MSTSITMAREFTRDELVRILSDNGQSLIDRAFTPKPDLVSLIKESVGTNTFRGFHKLSRQPSVIFREWAAANITGELFHSLAAENQECYDHVLDGFAKDLAEKWQSEGGRLLAFGPGRKLLNLLFKCVIRWSEIPESRRRKLIQLLHVPLDKYSLAAIRGIAKSGEFGPIILIPVKPRMGSITSHDQYSHIQDLMRRLAQLAKIPPIAIDLVAWNVAHSFF